MLDSEKQITIKPAPSSLCVVYPPLTLVCFCVAWCCSHHVPPCVVFTPYPCMFLCHLMLWPPRTSVCCIYPLTVACFCVAWCCSHPVHTPFLSYDRPSPAGISTTLNATEILSLLYNRELEMQIREEYNDNHISYFRRLIIWIV